METATCRSTAVSSSTAPVATCVGTTYTIAAGNTCQSISTSTANFHVQPPPRQQSAVFLQRFSHFGQALHPNGPEMHPTHSPGKPNMWNLSRRASMSAGCASSRGIPNSVRTARTSPTMLGTPFASRTQAVAGSIRLRFNPPPLRPPAQSTRGRGPP